MFIRSRRRVVGALAAGGLVASVTIGASVAHAADPVVPHVKDGVATATYNTTGTTHVQRGDFDVRLPKSHIVADLSAEGAFSASLPIPTSHVVFKAFGYLPVTADVAFTQVGQALGQLGAEPDPTDGNQIRGVVEYAKAAYVVTLRNVTVGGVPANIGDACQTVYPVRLSLKTPDGAMFDASIGGPITGTYTLPKFQNCGTSTDLTNIIVPGPGNTITVTLVDGHVVFHG